MAWPEFLIGGPVFEWVCVCVCGLALLLGCVCVWLCCWVVFVFVCVGVVMGSMYNGCVLCVEPVLGGRNKNGC